MKKDTNWKWSVAALSFLGITSALTAAQNGRDGNSCKTILPATCYGSNCVRTYCLGPENHGVNAPVRPRTCNGDWVATVSGFYWNTHQDGMEYAILNELNPSPANNPDEAAIINAGLNTLEKARFLNPKFDWNFGFKLGLGYNTLCDGWDLGVYWTWYKGRASSDEQSASERDNTSVILPILSAFAPKQGLTLYATRAQTNWKLHLNVIDLELGREFWSSKYLSMRPFIGLRIAYLSQRYVINYKGGSWASSSATTPNQTPQNNAVTIHNDYHGAGLRGGLDTVWNLGCGWAIYGNFALATLHGRFEIDHDDANYEATPPYDKTKIADTQSRFRALRAVADLGLGIEYQTTLDDCRYGFTAKLGWEHHLFFDQNQMWRAVRIGDGFNGGPTNSLINNTGENVYHQRRGDLDTQGWTLTLRFEF